MNKGKQIVILRFRGGAGAEGLTWNGLCSCGWKISFRFLHPNTDVFTFSCGIWRSRHVWFLRSCVWRYCFVFIFNADLSPRVLRFALCCFRETEIKHLLCLVLQLTSIIVFILKIACKFDPSQMSEINTALK